IVFSLTTISFLVNRRLFAGTLFTALHADKNSPIRIINLIFANRLFKGMKNLIQKYIISMVSKSQIKLITSLHQKKYRKEHQLFIVEGKKAIEELLSSTFEVVFLFSTTTENHFKTAIETQIIPENDLKKMSALN